MSDSKLGEVCVHDVLKRSCELCLLEQEAETKEAELIRLRSDLAAANQRAERAEATLNAERDASERLAASNASIFERSVRSTDGLMTLAIEYDKLVVTLKADAAALARECEDTRAAIEQRGEGIMLPASAARQDGSIGSLRITKMLAARKATDDRNALRWAKGVGQ